LRTNYKIPKEEYDQLQRSIIQQHAIISNKPHPISILENLVPSDRYNYNNTYPLTKPIKSRLGVKYRIGIISDLDTASKNEDNGEVSWISHYQRGWLQWNPATHKVSVTWDPGAPIILKSSMAQGGRGMELSELVVYDGKLLALDDRTGVIYEIVDQVKPRVVPWVLLPDGDGHVSKGEELIIFYFSYCSND
jgi:soluble calcium-activated nucleotidase 1